MYAIHIIYMYIYILYAKGIGGCQLPWRKWVSLARALISSDKRSMYLKCDTPGAQKKLGSTGKTMVLHHGFSNEKMKLSFYISLKTNPIIEFGALQLGGE